jgi:nitroreductase
MTETKKAELLAAVMRERRSINLFDAGAIDDALIYEAVELARWAPNHRLTEPWMFYLLGPVTAAAFVDLGASIEAVAKGERAGEHRRQRLQGVPGSFVLTTRVDRDELTDRENYAACCCAAQNLMLYLWARGVGTKWTTGGVTRDPRFFALIGADPGQERVVGHFWYGRPKLVGAQKRRDPASVIRRLP